MTPFPRPDGPLRALVHFLFVVSAAILASPSPATAAADGRLEGRLVDPDGADGVLGTIDDDLTPRSSSPAVDAASNSLLPADELDVDSDGDVLEPLPIDAIGRPRRADDPNVPDTGSGTPPIVDMGSRERAQP